VFIIKKTSDHKRIAVDEKTGASRKTISQTPVIIGFLQSAYVPVTTSFCLDDQGASVPFAILLKRNSVQANRHNPASMENAPKRMIRRC
jgi:hypothetical protein